MTWKSAGVGLLAAAMVTGAAGIPRAQSAARRATSPSALLAYPGFFQGQPVVVRGTLATRDRAVLLSPLSDRAVLLVFSGPSPADGPVELRGSFWDVGRLDQSDPRLESLGLMDLLPPSGDDTPWPRPGEMPALVVTSGMAVDDGSEPSTLRLLALDPGAYAGQRVTVTGQFRGRNLYGDLPQAPGISQWDFVVRSGEAAVWVTGGRPRGKGFDLDVGARVDTRTWLQITGTAREAKGLVWIEAAQLALASPDVSPSFAEAPPPPPIGPAPEVIFSDPQDGDTDAGLKKPILLQFSRDMSPDSFTGNVRCRYTGADGRDEVIPPQQQKVRYDGANRSLEIAIDADSLFRYRSVTVELADGITATDGARLKPWTMTFTFGGA